MRGAIFVSPQNFGTTIAEAQYVDQLTNADGTPTHLQVDRSLITFAYSGSSSLILCAVNAGPRPAAALCRTQSAPSGTNTNYSLEITYNGTIAQETIDRLNTFFTILFTVELLCQLAPPLPAQRLELPRRLHRGDVQYCIALIKYKTMYSSSKNKMVQCVHTVPDGSLTPAP